MYCLKLIKVTTLPLKKFALKFIFATS